jgi:hypothetical protein
MQVTTIGLDLAKHVFQIHGIDAAEKVVVRKQLRRSRPDTWLHPNASRRRQIPLASRAPSIRGTFATSTDVRCTTGFGGQTGH